MNEYIDRDALRQAVLESQHDNPHPRGMAHIAHDCEHAHFVAMIARFPAADVAPVVHARWIHSRYEDCSEQFELVKCSQCNHEAYAMAFYVRGGNYCPNCGAKMDGGAE
jgi:hypothetical protein